MCTILKSIWRELVRSHGVESNSRLFLDVNTPELVLREYLWEQGFKFRYIVY